MTCKPSDAIHQRLMHQIRELFQIEDIRGVEVFSALTRTVRLLEMIEARQPEGDQPITGARWRLLLHLFLTEQLDHIHGLTPTELSRFQQVSKNTVSALLRGLEEQGYINRQMDPSDLRVFRIHLSEAGRQIMLATGPARVLALNQLLDGLTQDEVSQLIILLNRLRRSLEAQACPVQGRLTPQGEPVSPENIP